MSRELSSKYISANISSLLKEKPTGTLLVDEISNSLWMVGPTPDSSIQLAQPFVDITGTAENWYLEFQQVTLENHSLQWTLLASTGPAPNTVTAVTVYNLLQATSIPISGNNINTVSFPALTTVGYFEPYYMNNVTSLNFPALTTVGNYFVPYYMNNITVLDFPSLTTVGSGFDPGYMPSLTTMNFPALTTVGNDMYINDGCPALEQARFPALQTVTGGIYDYDEGLGNANNFHTLNLGTNLLQVGGNVSFTISALNQTSVDNLLIALANLDGTGGTTLYENHTVTITGPAAAPGTAGLSAVTTLQNRGCTVTTN